MNNHLNEEQLIGYVHHTLTDAQRETMSQHLTVCPDCRARLAEHEAIQRHIRHSLSADLKGVRPSGDMTFSAVALPVKRPSRFAKWWGPTAGQLLPAATGLAAVAGLILASVGLMDKIGQLTGDFAQVPLDPLPTMACFLLAVPAVGNYFESRTVPLRVIFSGVVAIILWLGTAVVGLQAMVVLRNIFAWIFMQLMSDMWHAIGLSNWSLIPLGIVWLAAVVLGGEYHYRRLGQRSSWKLFGWTIAVELLIVGLPLLW